MNRRVRSMISLIVIMAMAMSVAGCNTNSDSGFALRGDNGSSDASEEGMIQLATTVEDEDEDELEIEVSEDGFEYYVLPNGLTCPVDVADYDDIHPDYPAGDVEGDDAIELLNEIEAEFIAVAIDNYVDAVILYEDPEAMGIDIDEVSWGEFSSDNEEYLEMYREIRDELYTINPDSLEGQDRLFFDKLLYDVEESIYALTFTAFDYYESAFNPLTGPQNDIMFIMHVLSFETVEDAENYILLVQDIDRYYDEICEFEEEKADYGYALSDETYEDIAETFDALVAQEDDCFLYESFEDRLDNIEDLDDEDRERLIEEHEAAMHDYFFPEMEECAERMRALENGEGSDLGLSQYEGGVAYYVYEVRQLSNSATLTAEDHIDMIESRLDYIMDIYMDALTSSDRDWLDEYINHEYTMGDTEDNLEYLIDAVAEDFPELPDHDYFLMDVPEVFEDSFSPAAYLGYHLDNFDSNLIITNNANVDNNFGITCAHEGYPGHMFQSVYTRSMCDHPYLYLSDSTGYVEGWATYVEEYAFRYFAEEGTAADLVMVENELNILLMARWDIGIHYEDWSIEDCADFYESLFDGMIPVSPDEIQDIYNILLSDPCYAVKYGCGFLLTGYVIETIATEFPDAGPQEVFTAYLDSMPLTFEQIYNNMEVTLAE